MCSSFVRCLCIFLDAKRTQPRLSQTNKQHSIDTQKVLMYGESNSFHHGMLVNDNQRQLDRVTLLCDYLHSTQYLSRKEQQLQYLWNKEGPD